MCIEIQTEPYFDVPFDVWNSRYNIYIALYNSKTPIQSLQITFKKKALLLPRFHYNIFKSVL